MKKILLFLLLSFPIFINAQIVEDGQIGTGRTNSYLGEISDTVQQSDFFDIAEPLKISLKYDITSFIKHKNSGEYLDAELQINYDNLEPIVKNIRLKARGNFRRGQCFFPPIYLNFKTDPIKETELKDMRKMKIVTHCSNSKSSSKYILREFLAYKLYNALTSQSFRVRLLDINYIDTGKRQRNYREYGFIIEPVELVAQRNNAVVIKPKIVNDENVIEENADRVALFEYMIGNTDWKFRESHNMAYIKSKNEITDRAIAVPYDFDFAGFVDTNYSFPQEWTSIKDVRTREYLGHCRNSEENYLNVINYYVDKKAEIIQTIESFNYIDEREKKYLIRYIDSFYKMLSKPNSFVRVLQDQCRTDF